MNKNKIKIMIITFLFFIVYKMLIFMYLIIYVSYLTEKFIKCDITSIYIFPCIKNIQLVPLNLNHLTLYNI